jgi:hypothetical protein
MAYGKIIIERTIQYVKDSPESSMIFCVDRMLRRKKM